jgi:TPR repeat protein
MKKSLITLIALLTAMLLMGEVTYSDSLLQTAKSGNSEAQYELGCCYESGEGVDSNIEEAAKWFILSANNGNVDAQNTLGVYYENGEGVR